GAGDAWTFASVTAGIESTYARAAKRMLRFSNKHDDTIAHEWRKEVQRLANQLGTIKDLCPESLPVTLSALSELADLLGTHNDLSVLRTRIGRLPKRTRRIFSDVSKAEQRILRAHALTLGGEIFARSPEAFRRSLLGETPDSVA
ncbi:MAG: CHAD domain-containing protein, partial [Gammaproteobacteria bacterium]